MAKILIVDDSAIDRKTLQHIVLETGHDVYLAEDGEQGIEMTRTLHPDLVLMDVVMGELNGFEATRKLKAESETAGIPVILISSKSQDSDIAWGLRQGASAYVKKPVEARRLKELICDTIAAM